MRRTVLLRVREISATSQYSTSGSEDISFAGHLLERHNVFKSQQIFYSEQVPLLNEGKACFYNEFYA
jgi:hypothetical protein